MDDKEKLFKDRVRAMSETEARIALNSPAYASSDKKRWILDVIREFEAERLKRADDFNIEQIEIARSAKNAAWIAAIAAIIAAIVAIIALAAQKS